MSTPTKPARPVTTIKGTNTTADPSNCPGSGKTWETGGKCPVCGRTAAVLQDTFHVTARRADGSLTPRVPKHPASTDARAAADAAVLNGTRTADKVPGQAPAGVPEKPNTRKSTRSAPVPSSPQNSAPAKPTAKPVRSGSAKPAAKDGTKTAPTPKQEPKTRKVKDPLTAPFTPNIEAYLVWLKNLLATNKIDFNKIPRDRLAGLAITMYGRYQVSPERVAARNGG